MNRMVKEPDYNKNDTGRQNFLISVQFEHLKTSPSFFSDSIRLPAGAGHKHAVYSLTGTGPHTSARQATWFAAVLRCGFFERKKYPLSKRAGAFPTPRVVGVNSAIAFIQIP